MIIKKEDFLNKISSMSPEEKERQMINYIDELYSSHDQIITVMGKTNSELEAEKKIADNWKAFESQKRGEIKLKLGERFRPYMDGLPLSELESLVNDLSMPVKENPVGDGGPNFATREVSLSKEQQKEMETLFGHLPIYQNPDGSINQERASEAYMEVIGKKKVLNNV